MMRRTILAALIFFGSAGTVFAGAPEPWQMGLQTAASPTMVSITEFHNLLLVIISYISVFVMVLLLFVLVRFNAKRNPVPTKTTHNTMIEVLWTAVPVMILVIIAIPSFKLLYFMDRTTEPDMTLKVIGHQWYWSYEYPDHGNFTFDANMTFAEDLEDKSLRMMATDNNVVLPVGKKVRLLVTADDVVHSWGVPALGVKLDTVPGRLNETWVEVDRPGMYYGFCSELCGVNHSYMPIAIKAVSEDEFNAWVETAKQEFARVDAPTAGPDTRLAQTIPVE
jgi:cytochrome c oxidase subunit 2